ncbi:AAA domain-containing protein, partial [Candidatus Neomarinimicrobiota bacterium]
SNLYSKDNYFVLTAGLSINIDFENYQKYNNSTDNNEIINGEDQEETFEMEAIKSVSKDMRSFTIYCDGFKIPVERKLIDNREIYFASRLVANSNQKLDKAVRLAKGKLIFSDFTATGEIQRIARGQMESLIEGEDGYLKKWDEYGAVEGELLLEQAREIGSFGYYNSEIVDGGVKFYLNESTPVLLKAGDELELTREIPSYIDNNEMSWKEFESSLEMEYQFAMDIASKNTNKLEESTEKIENHAKIINIHDDSIVLEMSAKPKDKDLLFILSINGEKVQIKRRMRARELIKEGRCANPMLGPLIEEGGTLAGVERTTKIKALTPFVRDKIFEYDPTPIQEEAIRVALNTPDMALIQGPPGTGKTTVITAIIERLNEEFYKADKSIQGKILVTGFQHDAVENIVSRLSVNALPSVKFGAKSGSEYTENAVNHKIEMWCVKISDSIREKNPKIKESEEQLKLRELFFLYAIQPSDTHAINLLDQIIDLPRNKFNNKQLLDKTQLLLDSYKDDSNSLLNNKLRAIRLLRITENGFSDDGPQRATDVLEQCDSELDQSTKKILKKAILWKNSMQLDFIYQQKKIKKKLLLKYTPKPFYKINKPRTDIIAITAQVQKELESQQGSNNKKRNILANFLHELEDNPKGIEKALAAYNVVYASTVQQSEGNDIRAAKLLKRKTEAYELLEYDVVIVDEAARVSPRDLLIPMVQGKKVILVGDHRQLPHILNESVVKKLESNSDENNNKDTIEVDYVKNSMFRYLFKRLKKLEDTDNIPRIVTL